MHSDRNIIQIHNKHISATTMIWNNIRSTVSSHIMGGSLYKPLVLCLQFPKSIWTLGYLWYPEKSEAVCLRPSITSTMVRVNSDRQLVNTFHYPARLVKQMNHCGLRLQSRQLPVWTCRNSSSFSTSSSFLCVWCAESCHTEFLLCSRNLENLSRKKSWTVL